MLYACDFETTTLENDCRVWAYGTSQIGTDQFQYGNNIDDFMKWCEIGQNKTCYFHYMKFDAEFIISWLLQNRFEYSQEPKTRSFDWIVSETGIFYQIRVVHQKKGKKTNHTTFINSYNILPFKVKKIAEDFKLPISKLDLDYDTFREKGHVLTPHEVEYLKNDVMIMSQALSIVIAQKLKKMTIASSAFTFFQDLIGKDTYKNYFPVLDLEVDKDIRLSYKGGFTYLNPKYVNKTVGNGIVLDVNSMYPWAMKYCKLPYGYPIYFDGEYKQDDEYPLYIIKLRCCFEIKKDHIPTIQLKHNLAFLPNEYIEKADEPVTLYLTNVDYELFKDHYDVYEEVIECGWKFKAMKGIFTTYIDHWMNIKENSTGAIRAIAKLMLNSLYGRFGKNPDVTGKYPILDENGVVKWKLKEKEMCDPVYTALASFVTAWARDRIIRSAQKVYDRFIYADTDSLHLLDDEVPKELQDMIHDTKLGYWKIESHFEKAKFIRQKTYCEVIDGKCNIKCAGMPDNVKELVDFDTFNIGLNIPDKKLRPKRVKGGVVLVPQPFEIKKH